MNAERPANPTAAVDTPIDHNFHLQPSDKLRRWESTLPEAYWDYRNRWMRQPRDREAGIFPIHLDIEATSACNLRCTMCPRTEKIADGTFWRIESFDYDLYTRLIDEGVRHGLCSVKYNYLGEPTLNKRLIDMIVYAKQAGVLDVMFNTNATLLDESLSRRLIASGLDKLFFSVDSPEAGQFEQIRPGAHFSEVIENIRRFTRIRDELGSVKPFTRVSMVLMRENQDRRDRFRRLFEPIVDAVAFVDYLDHGSQSNPDKTHVALGSRQGKFCCPQLWQRMFVHPDGVVTVCCLDSDRELQVGNVHAQSVSEIWTSPRYQELRRLHATGRSHDIPTCARCPLGRY